MSYAWGETANEPPATPPWSEWFAPTNARPGPPTPDEAAERPEAVIRRLQIANTRLTAELRTLAQRVAELERRTHSGRPLLAADLSGKAQAR